MFVILNTVRMLFWSSVFDYLPDPYVLVERQLWTKRYILLSIVYASWWHNRRDEILAWHRFRLLPT